MDVTTLFNGAAQAGPARAGAAVAAAAAGGAAGPPAAGAGPDGDFASLVALALGQLGAPAVADGEAEPIAGRSTPRSDGAVCTDIEPVICEAPLDAPDAATLAVLVALATPVPAVAVPVSADLPVATVTGDAPVAATVDGGPAVSYAPVPAVLAPEPAVAAGGATAATGPSFADAVSAAEQAVTPDASAGSAPAAPVPTPSDRPATSAAGVTDAGNVPPPATPQASRTTPQASAAAEPAPAQAITPSTGTPSTGTPSAGTPASMPPARLDGAGGAAPSPRAAAAPRREIRAAAQQVRDILATAQHGAAPTAPAAPVAPASPFTVAHAPVAAGVQGQGSATPAPESAPGAGRTGAVAAPASAVATSGPATETRSDADASGERGAEAGPIPAGGSAVRTAPALDLRFDAGAPVPTAAPALDAPAAIPPVAPPLPSTEPLRAIELPASARLEQALAALDPETRNLQAIVRTVRLFTAGDGLSEARLRLEPDHLGPLSLTVRVEQGSVSAHFRAETPAAQRWIETHQQELRAGLREQGLEVKDVVVTTDPDGRRDRRQEGQPARSARLRRTATPDGDAPRFEVLA